jgi:hypothetical protein
MYQLKLVSVHYSKLTVSIDCDIDVNDQNEETRIKNKLFCNGYDSSVRPVFNHTQTTSVRVKMMVKSYDFVLNE